jgi:hypothetical protein
MSELQWFKGKVYSMLEDGMSYKKAIEKAMLYTHPRFFMTSLHNELQKDYGNIDYYPPNLEADYEYIRKWLHYQLDETVKS